MRGHTPLDTATGRIGGNDVHGMLVAAGCVPSSQLQFYGMNWWYPAP